MNDPNMSDFYGRVARIERARKKGHGFEASGALGRSYYGRPAAKRRSILGPVVIFMLCIFLLKGTMYNQIGASLYDSRVSALRTGKGIERVGGWLMLADPITIMVGDTIGKLLLKIK